MRLLTPQGELCWRRAGRAVLAALAVAFAGVCHAQFSMVPTPVPAPDGATSDAETAADYTKVVARHLYAAYPIRIFRGRLPPLLYGVAIVEVDIDAQGGVTDVRVTRKPAAPEVGPWIVSMIRRAAPYPVPSKLGKTTLKDIWLVHQSGRFQLDTLTEGQD